MYFYNHLPLISLWRLYSPPVSFTSSYLLMHPPDNHTHPPDNPTQLNGPAMMARSQLTNPSSHNFKYLWKFTQTYQKTCQITAAWLGCTAIHHLTFSFWNILQEGLCHLIISFLWKTRHPTVLFSFTSSYLWIKPSYPKNSHPGPISPLSTSNLTLDYLSSNILLNARFFHSYLWIQSSRFWPGGAAIHPVSFGISHRRNNAIQPDNTNPPVSFRNYFGEPTPSDQAVDVPILFPRFPLCPGQIPKK